MSSRFAWRGYEPTGPMLSIFLAHNYYRSSSPSGENTVFEAEAGLLSAKGHAVYRYLRDSDDIAGCSLADRAALPAQLIWSHRSYLEIKRILADLQPDVAHFHNTFPLISVSAYRACREAGVPVVQTLHNYRPLCMNGVLLRNGAPCEDCVHLSLPWPGVIHRCYRGSLSYSAVMAVMQLTHRLMRIWRNQVDLFIAPSEFVRRKYVGAGFDADKIIVKPHFAGCDTCTHGGARRYALFAGRLSPEKGVCTLLAAWKSLPHIPLVVVGGGPAAGALRAAANGAANVSFVGGLSHSKTLAYIKGAKYLIVPSECYESFSMVILEAFANATPVIGSRLGAIPEILAEGQNGLLFAPGDSADLATRANYLWSHPEAASTLGRRARQDYEARFTPERNYRNLLTAYDLASRFYARRRPAPAHPAQTDALPQPR